jgi:hypothetical protein
MEMPQSMILADEAILLRTNTVTKVTMMMSRNLKFVIWIFFVSLFMKIDYFNFDLSGLSIP